MSITAAMVKELRERTGSGMMECKKALVAAEGNLELAIEQMRKSGLAKADKKSGRTAAEGRIGVKVSADGKHSAIVDINCETDFVSKGDEFSAFVDAVTDAVLESDVSTLEQINDMKLATGLTVDQTRREMIARLGENIHIRRFAKCDSDVGGSSCYLHGSRIGVITELSIQNAELGKDISMHIAASNPVCIDESGVPDGLIEKEKSVFSAQAEASGKPAEIIEKMISGRVRKFLSEITLLGQPFIKETEISVEKLLKGKNATVISFTRFEVGEGIEKKEENFAEEVKAQIEATQQ